MISAETFRGFVPQNTEWQATTELVDECLIFWNV